MIPTKAEAKIMRQHCDQWLAVHEMHKRITAIFDNAAPLHMTPAPRPLDSGEQMRDSAEENVYADALEEMERWDYFAERQ